MCIYFLKEFIEFGRSRNTSVFVTFEMLLKHMIKLIIDSCLTNY